MLIYCAGLVMSGRRVEALTFLKWFAFMGYLFENDRPRQLRGNFEPRFVRRTSWIVTLLIGFWLTDAMLVSVSGQGIGDVGTDSETQTARLWAQEETPLYVEHCLSCHQGATAEAGLDLSSLGRDLADPENMRRWVLVHDRIHAGEMPPENEPRIDLALQQKFLASLSHDIDAAQRLRNDVVLRRLNRVEYENSVRDVFGISVMVKDLLPQDASTDGFDNVGEGLAVSAEAMRAYLDAADAVIESVLGPEKRPKFINHITNLNDQRDHLGNLNDNQFGKMFRRTEAGLVIFQSNYCPTNLVNFARLRAPAGTYHGTIRVRAIQSDKPVTMRIYGGDTIVGRAEKHLVGYYDIEPDKWQTIEFVDRLVQDRGTFQPKCYGTIDTRKDADTYPNPGLEIGEITIQGPLEMWPPASRKQLLGGVELETGTVQDAGVILGRCLPRLYRRPVEKAELTFHVEIVRLAMDAGESFGEGLKQSLKTALCSPEFLFLEELVDEESGEGRIGPYALAARLSYFLWSSTPDDELLTLAGERKLRDPQVLRQQVERLLRDSRSKAFTENFTGQWLGLRDIDFTAPDGKLFPEFDELLKISMVAETEAFFNEVLDKNLSIMNFVDSDFVMLNGRLAAHYGIEGVQGQAIRKVRLPEGSVRGGVMTQGSVLKVTANGTHTSPVLRGAWVLENLLGIPPAVPPPNIPAVEPDARGALTLRQQLEKHRDQASCAICHDKIDPPGFALENFNAIGGWRDHYRTMGDGERPELRRAPFTFNYVRYKIGHPVDASGETVDQTAFQDVTEFKKWMLKEKNAIATGLSRKLLTYGLGRRLGFSDRAQIKQLVLSAKEKGYGFRDLVHLVVQSKLFQQR